MFEYYGKLFDGIEYETYDSIYKCLKTQSENCSVPAFEIKNITNIYSAVKLDHPEIFYAGGFSWSQRPGRIVITPKYSFDKNKTETISKAIEKRAERIISPALSFGEKEKELFVHDWIVNNVTYTALYKNYSHEIYGVLNHGIGVCEGIAKCAKLFFDKLGLDSLVVVSEPNENRFSHAWNIVYVYGKPYHVDVTFDLSSKSKKYYNKNDEYIFESHGRPFLPVPKC